MRIAASLHIFCWGVKSSLRCHWCQAVWTLYELLFMLLCINGYCIVLFFSNSNFLKRADVSQSNKCVIMQLALPFQLYLACLNQLRAEKYFPIKKVNFLLCCCEEDNVLVLMGISINTAESLEKISIVQAKMSGFCWAVWHPGYKLDEVGTFSCVPSRMKHNGWHTL